MLELTDKQKWLKEQFMTIILLDTKLTNKDIVTVLGYLINKFKYKKVK